jgi:cysteine desulfurase
MSTEVLPQIEATKVEPERQPTNGHGIKLPIYMDNHATTPVDPRVLEEMLPYFADKFGNAASRNHSFGWAGEEGVETARERIAKLIGATTKEIIFTSGATESDNLAIKGVAEMYREKGNHIITAVTEHKAVLDTCKRLEKYGYRVTYLPVQKDGLVDLDDLKRAIEDKTILVTIMAANNEIGVLQPIAEIGKLCHEKGVIFHTDATQAVGKVPIDVMKQNLDLVSISAHKMYGPKGVGALYVRRKGPRVQLAAVIDGGGHERGMRSGTLNVPGIVGLGKACAICMEEMPQESARLSGLRDRLKNKIMTGLDEVYINGSMEHRLPQNLNISFAYVEGESLLMGINDVAVSSGSACTSATLEPSYVLKALGTGDDLAHSSIRFGLGRFNTEAEVDYVAERVIDTVQRLRELSPLYEMAKEGIDLKSVKWAAE